jgi:deazaflavin-dependent oxidoreductase (nitroreductase family)
MWKFLTRVLTAALVAVAAVGVVFVAGMRWKSPPVLNAVRRTSRATKPFVLKTAGKPGGPASVIHHVGRTTGRSYETPVRAVPTADGFVIALPYGSNTDWLKNVLASGSATIVDEGSVHRVDDPQVVPLAVAGELFPPGDRRTFRLIAVDQFLLVRRRDPA